MYFTILAGIIITYFAEVSGVSSSDSLMLEFWHNPMIILLLTLVLTAAAPLPGILLSTSIRPEQMQEPCLRDRVYRRVRFGALFCQAWVVGLFALVTWLVQWPLLVKVTLRLQGVVLVDEFMCLAPFIAMLILAWMPFHRIDRALRMGSWTMREYIEYHVRQYLLFILVPIGALVAVNDLLDLLPWAPMLESLGLSWLINVVAVVAIYVFAPLAVRNIWKTRPLEDGPLRERLMGLSARAGAGQRDILVWETLGGHIPNACIIGVAAPLRYIMVTDALMDTLSTEEIESVFAHEIGHAKHQHMTYYVLFAFGLGAIVACLSALPGFDALRSDSVGDMMSLPGLLVVGVAIVYWGAGFSFVSRRMELEADLYAATLTGGAANFVNGLERIGQFSARPRTANGWRHFSIARRTEFLLACEADPARGTRFETQMKLLRRTIIAVAALAFAGAAIVTWLNRG